MDLQAQLVLLQQIAASKKLDHGVAITLARLLGARHPQEAAPLLSALASREDASTELLETLEGLGSPWVNATLAFRPDLELSHRQQLALGLALDPARALLAAKGATALPLELVTMVWLRHPSLITVKELQALGEQEPSMLASVVEQLCLAAMDSTEPTSILPKVEFESNTERTLWHLQAANLLSTFLSHAEFPSSCLGFVPVPLMGSAVTALASGAAERLGELLTEALGTDPIAWSLYFELSETFQGSYAALLGAVKGAAATRAAASS